MALLDAYGRPVKTQVLTEMQAEPRVAGVRQAFASTFAAGLTPSRLGGILRSCDNGDLEAFVTLSEEMEERDPHYFSVLGTRKRAVSGVDPRVEPADGSAEAKRIAKAVEERIAEHDDFPDLVEDLLDSLGKGFSLVEIDWQRSASEWWPRGWVHVDPRFVRFNRETGREMRLLDEADVAEGISLAPYGFIQMRSRLKSGLTFRGSIARVVAFSWMCKAYTLKDWMSFVETYGLPLRVGRYDSSATAKDREQLLRAVANIGTDAAAIIPENMRIDFTEVKSQGGDKIFENLARYVDEQVSKAVLGQTMTSDDGSSLAQAAVHNEVRHDIAKADARKVTAALNRDLVRPYVDLNYGPQKLYPKLSIDIEEAEDTDAVIQNVERMAGLGVRFGQNGIRARLGFDDPVEGEEVVRGATAAPAPPTTELEARNRAIPEGSPWWDELDALEAEAGEGWREAVDPMTGPIDRAIERAGSFEEALALLEDEYPNMEAGPLVDRLVKAMLKARGMGDVRDG